MAQMKTEELEKIYCCKIERKVNTYEFRARFDLMMVIVTTNFMRMGELRDFLKIHCKKIGGNA